MSAVKPPVSQSSQRTRQQCVVKHPHLRSLHPYAAYATYYGLQSLISTVLSQSRIHNTIKTILLSKKVWFARFSNPLWQRSTGPLKESFKLFDLRPSLCFQLLCQNNDRFPLEMKNLPNKYVHVPSGFCLLLLDYLNYDLMTFMLKSKLKVYWRAQLRTNAIIFRLALFWFLHRDNEYFQNLIIF